jgi:hypothetical protein
VFVFFFRYPKHVDNVGLPDHRVVTCILYLNDEWEKETDEEGGGDGDGDGEASSKGKRGLQRWGGELRVWGNNGVVEDVAPSGDRMVLFLSDQVVHEVLPNTAPPPPPSPLRPTIHNNGNTNTNGGSSSSSSNSNEDGSHSIGASSDLELSSSLSLEPQSGPASSALDSASPGLQEGGSGEEISAAGGEIGGAAPVSDDDDKDKDDASRRFALTIWLVTENTSAVGDDDHPLAAVRHEHFPVHSTTIDK